MPVPASFIPESRPKSFVPDPGPAPISKPQLAPVVTSPFQGLSANLPGAPQTTAPTQKATEETMNAVWDPKRATAEIGEGAKNLASYRAGPGYGKRAVRGANQLIEGTAEAGKPAVLAAALTNPVTTGVALAAGMTAQHGTEAGLRAAGVDPEVARLGGNAAGALPIVGGAAKIGRGILDRFRLVEPLPSAPLPPPRPPVPEPAAAAAPPAPPPAPAVRRSRPRLTPEQQLERARAENARLKTPQTFIPEKQVSATPEPAPQGKEVIPQAQPEVPPAGRPVSPDDVIAAAREIEPDGMLVTNRQLAEKFPEADPQQLQGAILAAAKRGDVVLNETSHPPSEKGPVIPIGNHPDGTPKFASGLALKAKDQPTSYRQETQRGSWSERARQPGAPPEDKYVNFDRLNVSPEEKLLLRQQTREWGQENFGLREKPTESFNAILKAVEGVTPEAVAQVSDPASMGTEVRAARHAIAQRLVALTKELAAEQSALAVERPSLAPEALAAREAALARKQSDHKELIGTWSNIGTSDARNLAMRRMVAAALEQAANPTTKNTTNWMDMILAVRKAGLLTGLKTHARNLISTGAFQVMEEAARLPSSMVDIAISAFSRQRTTAGPSMRGVVNASQHAATKGVQDAMNILRGRGATAQSDVPHELNFQELGKASNVINTYVNSVFRALSAEDAIFRAYAMRRSIEAQAKVIALNESRAGAIPRKYVIRRATELSTAPTESMAAQAIADSEFATFNNENRLARGLSAFKGHLSKPGQFAMDMVIPFTRTPSNIGARLMDYTPPGAGWTVGKSILAAAKEKKLAPEQQRAIAEAIGRGAVGSGLILMGYLAAQKGIATGVDNGDPSRRATLEAVGRPSGAVKVGGDWRRIMAFAPIGNLVAVGASIYEQHHAPLKDEAKRWDKVAAVAAKTLLDQPMVTGLEQAVDVAKDPAREGRQMAGQMVGSFVPTAVADIATATDDRRRDTRTAEGFGKSVGQVVQNRIPGLRNALPERRDVLGQPVEGRRTAAVDPLLSQTAKEDKDPLIRELVKHQIALPLTKRRPGEQDEEYRLRQQARGVAIRRAGARLVTLPAYQSASPDKQKMALEKQLRKGDDFVEKLANTPRYKQSNPTVRIQMMQGVISKYQ